MQKEDQSNLKIELIYDEDNEQMELRASFDNIKDLILMSNIDEMAEYYYAILDSIIASKDELEINVDDISYHYYCHDAHHIEKFLLCSSPANVKRPVNTWIYKRDGIFYCEIAPALSYESLPTCNENSLQLKPLYKKEMSLVELYRLLDLFAKATILIYKNLYFNCARHSADA